jgi:Rad3-related DNA helicase
VRAQPGFDNVTISWDNLNLYLQRIGDGFIKLAGGLADISEHHDIDEGENLRLTLLSTGQTLAETRANLDGILMEPQPGMIYWVEIFRERISLHAAPLHVGPLVEQNIFHAMETVVLTSATLRTASPHSPDEPTFHYIQERLHAHDVSQLAVGSPFDYENQTLLYLVTDIPEPNQPGYQRMVEDAIIDVATALGGRTMALFTAYSQLSQTAQCH